MTVLPMRIFGDPILREPCRDVERFDASLEKLGADLLDAMTHYSGVGVAANQIGISLRAFVYDDDGTPRWLVNAEIADLDGEESVDEGCLSVPGLYFPTARAARLQLKGVDLEGTSVEFVAEGFLARVMQHETDHLKGLLYLDRLDDVTRREAMRQIREQDMGAREVQRRT
ncbi:MAG: peptide deformylase [Actinomycetota bacterium]